MSGAKEPEPYDITSILELLKTSEAPMSRLAIAEALDVDRKHIDARGPLIEQHPNVDVEYAADGPIFYQWID